MTNLPKLSDIMNIDDLEREIADGYVKRRFHDTVPAALVNYSEKSQYEYRFNEVTGQCRGLIYNTETLEILARPWKKFHVWDARGQQYPPAGPMLLAPKMDGSMLTSWWPDNDRYTPAMASRGSFTSDQAVYGTELFERLVRELPEKDQIRIIGDLSNPFRTYLWELLAPWNRIVCDYGDAERIVLLDVLDNVTGKQDIAAFDALPWPDKAEKTLVPGGFSDSLTHDIPENEEGFVLSWPEKGFMCKMKSARYLELHRIIFGLSAKSIWAQIADGQTIEEIKSNLPDEFFGFADDVYHKLRKQQLERYNEVLEAWNQIAGMDGEVPPILTRKDFAMKAIPYKDLSKYLFRIFDGAQTGEILEMVWKTLKPVGDTHVKSQSEDVA